MTTTVLIALAITLLAEVPIVALIYRGERGRMALTCALATTATNLAMNTLLLGSAGSYSEYLLSGEAGALLMEAGVFVLVSRDHDVGRALVASAIANGASFGLGLLLMP
jgi:hypothetical protein